MTYYPKSRIKLGKTRKSFDTGYSSICSGCNKRLGENPALIGKERVIELVDCDECAEFKKNLVNRSGITTHQRSIRDRKFF